LRDLVTRGLEIWLGVEHVALGDRCGGQRLHLGDDHATVVDAEVERGVGRNRRRLGARTIDRSSTIVIGQPTLGGAVGKSHQICRWHLEHAGEARKPGVDGERSVIPHRATFRTYAAQLRLRVRSRTVACQPNLIPLVCQGHVQRLTDPFVVVDNEHHSVSNGFLPTSSHHCGRV
jgi:hypothetical protein